MVAIVVILGIVLLTVGILIPMKGKQKKVTPNETTKQKTSNTTQSTTVIYLEDKNQKTHTRNPSTTSENLIHSHQALNTTERTINTTTVEDDVLG